MTDGEDAGLAGAAGGGVTAGLAGAACGTVAAVDVAGGAGFSCVVGSTFTFFLGGSGTLFSSCVTYLDQP